MARELQCHGHSFKGIAEPELSHNDMFYNDIFANLMALNLGWLSAYNAPHLVNLYQALGIPDDVNTLSSTHDYFLRGSYRENYTSSWMYDVLLAWESSQRGLASLTQQQQATTLIGPLVLPGSVRGSNPSHTVARINGVTNPHGISGTPSHDTGGHSLGMGLDWGFSRQYVGDFEIENNRPNTNYNSSEYVLKINTEGWVCTAAGSWSVSNAISAINQVANAAPDIPNEEKALRSFLSLYNTIMSDGDASNRNGSWEEISISNGGSLEDKNSIRAALFGNGTQTNPLIEHVWIGGAGRTNAWQRTNSALKALGISARAIAPHHHHYHIDFVAPSRRLIEPRNNLMADYKSADGAFTAVSSATNDVTIENLAFDLAKEWGLSENDMDMYFPVDMESTKPPVIMVAAANNKVLEKVVGVCTVADNLGGFDFGGAAQGYLIGQGKTLMEVDVSNVKIKLISIVKQPEHGRLLMDETGPYVAGTYIPEQGFVGKDRAEAIVSVGGDVVRVVYYFAVQSKPTDSLTDSQRKRLCPKNWWIISRTPHDSDLTAGDGEKSLLAILSGFGEMAFSNLSGAVLAQTTGTGADAKITLDTTAAGHGWFIDATPTYNEEFLPTADPNVWVAKAGSAAEGKMDMLTVLLHEYGHVLGLEHSADGADGMAATLKPGGRLWSAGDLAALARLGVSYVQNADGSLTLASA